MKKYRIIEVVTEGGVYYQIQKKSVFGFWKTYTGPDEEWSIWRSWGDRFNDLSYAKHVCSGFEESNLRKKVKTINVVDE